MKNIDFIRNQVSQGLWSFTFEDYRKALGINPKNALMLLRKYGMIISPVRGFYVIVPEEARKTNRVPVERYIDDMMKFLRVPYYVGLLTAAAFHGSAHQSPQVFQVITNPSRRTIQIGQNRIVFYRKKKLNSIPVKLQKTPTGYIRISTVEATFLDMIQFNRGIGGLDHVALVTSELIEQFTVTGLNRTAPNYPLPIVQRAGYLLERIGFITGAAMLEKWVNQNNPVYTYLNPSGSKDREPKHKKWKLIINDQLEYFK